MNFHGKQFVQDRIGIPNDRRNAWRHLLNWPQTHADVKPVENPVGRLLRRTIYEIAQTIRTISQHPDAGCLCPTVVIECGFHENLGMLNCATGVKLSLRSPRRPASTPGLSPAG
jgi:hypothetical protein